MFPECPSFLLCSVLILKKKKKQLFFSCGYGLLLLFFGIHQERKCQTSQSEKEDGGFFLIRSHEWRTNRDIRASGAKLQSNERAWCFLFSISVTSYFSSALSPSSILGTWKMMQSSLFTYTQMLCKPLSHLRKKQKTHWNEFAYFSLWLLIFPQIRQVDFN